MLAVFLGWPLAFGGHGSAVSGRVEAQPVAAVAVRPAKVGLVQASAPQSLPALSATQPESCYHRFQREVKLCSGSSNTVCRLKNADNWDLCEATGFWPN